MSCLLHCETWNLAQVLMECFKDVQCSPLGVLGCPLVASEGIDHTDKVLLSQRFLMSHFLLGHCPSASFTLASLFFFCQLIHPTSRELTPPNCSGPGEQATQSCALLLQFWDHPGRRAGVQMTDSDRGQVPSGPPGSRGGGAPVPSTTLLTPLSSSRLGKLFKCPSGPCKGLNS